MTRRAAPPHPSLESRQIEANRKRSMNALKALKEDVKPKRKIVFSLYDNITGKKSPNTSLSETKYDD